jgi:hypothetical protein
MVNRLARLLPTLNCSDLISEPVVTKSPRGRVKRDQQTRQTNGRHATGLSCTHSSRTSRPKRLRKIALVRPKARRRLRTSRVAVEFMRTVVRWGCNVGTARFIARTREGLLCSADPHAHCPPFQVHCFARECLGMTLGCNVFLKLG